MSMSICISSCIVCLLSIYMDSNYINIYLCWILASNIFLLSSIPIFVYKKLKSLWEISKYSKGVSKSKTELNYRKAKESISIDNIMNQDDLLKKLLPL